MQKGITIRLETTIFNHLHNVLSSMLTDRHTTFRLFLLRFYETGAIISVLGLIFGTCTIYWAAMYLPLSAYLSTEAPAPGDRPGSYPRHTAGQYEFAHSGQPLLQPIVGENLARFTLLIALVDPRIDCTP